MSSAPPTATTDADVTILNDLKIDTKQIDQLRLDYERLSHKLKLDDADAAAVLKTRIKLLHEYNDLKDTAAMLLNLYAHKTSTTLAEVYKEFEVNRINE